MYKDIDPSSGFKKDNRLFAKMTEKDKEDARKVYAMVSNIDDNIGKLLKELDDLNTLSMKENKFITKWSTTNKICKWHARP